MRMLKIKEADCVTDDYLEVETRATYLQMGIVNPWSSDTETGFGREGHIQLQREDVQKLVAFMNTWLETSDAEAP